MSLRGVPAKGGTTKQSHTMASSSRLLRPDVIGVRSGGNEPHAPDLLGCKQHKTECR